MLQVDLKTSGFKFYFTMGSSFDSYWSVFICWRESIVFCGFSHFLHTLPGVFFSQMATLKDMKLYVGKNLRLPHTWWGDKVAKKFYPTDWQTGHSVVKLTGHVAKAKGKEECLTFAGEDGETYLIGKSDLDVFWREGRFEGSVLVTV